MDNSVSDAVKILTRALNDDLNFRETYKANIAMAFYDEFVEQAQPNHGLDIHDIANKGAERFLNQWCNNK